MSYNMLRVESTAVERDGSQTCEFMFQDREDSQVVKNSKFIDVNVLNTVYTELKKIFPDIVVTEITSDIYYMKSVSKGMAVWFQADGTKTLGVVELTNTNVNVMRIVLGIIDDVFTNRVGVKKRKMSDDMSQPSNKRGRMDDTKGMDVEGGKRRRKTRGRRTHTRKSKK